MRPCENWQHSIEGLGGFERHDRYGAYVMLLPEQIAEPTNEQRSPEIAGRAPAPLNLGAAPSRPAAHATTREENNWHVV